jgi:hypothetical protein
MKFKCKVTNLVYNFEYEVDIMAMMKHPDYESVPDNEAVAEEAPVEETKPVKTSSKKSKVATDETNIDGA